MYQTTKFPNGLTVATATMPHMASVSVGIWVGVGGRYEPAPLNGVSHFIEHMLFKGTRKRSSREISQAVEGIGGYLNAFTGEESTCFYSKACYDRFEELLDVLTDMFLNSEFDPHEIDKERSVIKEELAMYLDQPHQHVQEMLNELLWPNQPLGRSLTGSAETLDSIDRLEMLDFQSRNYVTGCTLVTVAGRLDHAKIVKAVAKLAPRFAQGGAPRFQPAQNGQTAPRCRLFTKETEQTQLALGFRTCSRHHPERYALRILNTLLGDNMSSRLFQVVREDYGLAYSIASSVSFFDDTGDLTITAGLDTDHLPKALKLVIRELRRLVDEAPSAAELRRARDYLIGQLDLSLENTENQMMWLGEQLLGYGQIISAAEIKRRLAKVEPREVSALARRFFRTEEINLALVSPLKKPNGLSKLLKI